jgi:dGTPase
MIAKYACDPKKSNGRLHFEEETKFRNCFQRDRDRIIHSSAFRRLKHKTQVFVAHEGDYYRTRLTHSIEVAQVARTIAKVLNLNEELTEAIALAHDLGHTPFGHTGEDALDSSMKDYGGFDHNAQALKVVTFLEQHYAGWNGLNLTWETLEGLVKHNGPVLDKIPLELLEYTKLQDLKLNTNASGEAQVAALADDIAYNNHDIQDGLRAELFTVAELKEIPLVDKCFRNIDQKYTNIEESRIIHEVLRYLFGKMVEDTIETSLKTLTEFSFNNVNAIRMHDTKVIAFSSKMLANITLIREFLFKNMYRAPSVMIRREEATMIVSELFESYLNDSRKMPKEWDSAIKTSTTKEELAKIIADYIAGMTDRFAYQEAARLGIFADNNYLKFV